MSRIIRDVLYKRVTQCLHSTDPKQIASLVSTSSLRFDEDNKSICILLFPKSTKHDSDKSLDNLSIDDIHFKNINFVKDNTVIKRISLQCCRNEVIKTILESNVERVEPSLFLKSNRNVIVEFSSPNIAKPFHIGHLRSTILGNYIANINSYLGNKVHKINYLGDWGTQFGLVLLGLSQCQREDIQNHPIETLYKAYVSTNKLSETDPVVGEKARQIFESMEKGSEDYDAKWQEIKGYTTQELSDTYKRLGVSFDEYHWESMYNATNIKDTLSLIEGQGLLTVDEENRKVVSVNNKAVPIVKSDGSTLYLTRDIAAAIDRYQKYKFDSMYYVVDNSQAAHFNNLIETLKKMNMPWADKLEHVKFGRINGMSTRQGTAVFLKDLLDEINSVMYQKQKQSSTTKVKLERPDESTDILGISAVIINDFKQKRTANYNFDWDKALDGEGQTGVKLQYSHSRLVSLEENCGAELTSQCDPKYLPEPCVDELILLLGQFDEVLAKSYQNLEPSILTKYLFRLSHAINVALTQLRIKGEPSEVASQRLLLFRVSRNVLAVGLRLLGITPLSKM